MRVTLLLMAFLVAPLPALAQSDGRQDSERLKQLLENKFGQSQRRGVEPQGTRRDRPIEYYQVKPDGSVRSAPPPQNQGNDRRSSTEWLGLSPASSADGRIVVAQNSQRTIGVARDTFVIQLKPDVTGEQIDRLLSKYGLRVVRHVPSLGLLHVERPAEATRGVVPQAGNIAEVLDPPIVRAIRGEEGVEGAFVDTTIGPKSMPRKSETKVRTTAGQMGWHWRHGDKDDGNWGLKMLRMPPVWSVLDRHRQQHPDGRPTRMTFLDVGFGTHGHLVYSAVKDGMPPNPLQASCQLSHGTHVAGIAGALFGRGRGIDGMVPNGIVEAIPITADSWIDGNALGVTNAVDQRALLYSGAIEDLAEFLEEGAPLKENERRVVNISLAYNWSAAGFEWGKDTERDQSLKTHVLNSAMVVRFLANKWRDRVLFVTAAGNDSYGLAEPLSAELATPFAFAGTYRSPTFRPAANIVVVEAIDRDGRRAPFSNTGGHVSAPGVDIMSTLASVSDEYGLCSGTSQAAPHVTALAAILFELAPKATPMQIADAIRSSALGAPGSGAAPRVDALAAVLAIEPKALQMLADLDGDGRVDEDDLLLLKQHFAILEAARRTDSRIEVDLNGDGDVDENERCWPRADLNGSGRASLDTSDMIALAGRPRSDIDALQMAWSTDGPKDFRTAYAENAMDALLEIWKGFSMPPAPVDIAQAGKEPGMNTASVTPAGQPETTGSLTASGKSRVPCQ